MTRPLITFGLFVLCVALSQVRAIAQPDPARAFKLGDTNNDGKMSKDEFLKLVSRNPRLKDNPEQAARVFNRLDTNKDGFLSFDEYKMMFQLGKGQPPSEKKAANPTSNAGSGFNDKPTAEQLAFFEKKIRPVLIEQCYKCHSATSEKIKGGFVLDTRDGIRKGGDSGAAIAPGHPEKSGFIRAVHYKDETMKMPPKDKLPEAAIADLEAWVKMGAPDPRDGVAKAVVKGEIDIEKGRTFWAFQKPKKTAPPKVQNSDWVRSDIDQFVMAGLGAKGLKPVGDADKRTLIRRASLDLTGLPPTPDEVEAFVADSSPAAFEKVVDRLLASPRFGERWGRHWLDVARYAETSGRTSNFNYPQAWRYRDYAIASFNSDKPYDLFIKEQLAGDLMTSSDPKLKSERTIATGFLAIGPRSLNERNRLQFELDNADEQIDVTSQAFLGITAACARCHDHKFDPIPMKDYYALAGIFRSTETCYGTVALIQSQRPSPLIPLPKEGNVAAKEHLSPEARKRLETQLETVEKRDAAEPIDRLRKRQQITTIKTQLDAYEADGNPKMLAMGVREKFRAADSPIYARGETDKPGSTTPRGVLQVVSTTAPAIRSGSGRLQLANWIANADNPLTSRVMVNRVWLHLFGRGLVPTPDNFGAAGQPPDNPALLDSLAISFTQDGWSVKKLIRKIVLSHAYQLDSRTDAKNFDVDPDNALIWRMTPRRLDAEALRDSMLAVSGQLDFAPPKGSVIGKAGEGPSLRPGPGGNVQQAVNDPRNNSRSVYLPVIRDNLPEALSLFDAADPSTVVAERPITSVPAQGLFLLNSPFVMRVSGETAKKLLSGTTTDSERIRSAYLAAYGRPPRENELQTATEFLEKYAKVARKNSPQADAWAAFCQALFASAEFQYRK